MSCTGLNLAAASAQHVVGPQLYRGYHRASGGHQEDTPSSVAQLPQQHSGHISASRILHLSYNFEKRWICLTILRGFCSGLNVDRGMTDCSGQLVYSAFSLQLPVSLPDLLVGRSLLGASDSLVGSYTIIQNRLCQPSLSMERYIGNKIHVLCFFIIDNTIQNTTHDMFKYWTMDS